MGGDKACYRREIEKLIIAQRVEKPLCPYDGKPCEAPERGCYAVAFGSTVSDSGEKFLWRCTRFKGKRVLREST